MGNYASHAFVLWPAREFAFSTELGSSSPITAIAPGDSDRFYAANEVISESVVSVSLSNGGGVLYWESRLRPISTLHTGSSAPVPRDPSRCAFATHSAESRGLSIDLCKSRMRSRARRSGVDHSLGMGEAAGSNPAESTRLTSFVSFPRRSPPRSFYSRFASLNVRSLRGLPLVALATRGTLAE